jgi:hypothetical protein
MPGAGSSVSRMAELEPTRHNAFQNARSLFRQTAVSWRGLVVLIACEASVGGVGTYVASSGSHSARVTDIAAKVAKLDAPTEAQEATRVRVALYAVRSELGRVC